MVELNTAYTVNILDFSFYMSLVVSNSCNTVIATVYTFLIEKPLVVSIQWAHLTNNIQIL